MRKVKIIFILIIAIVSNSLILNLDVKGKDKKLNIDNIVSNMTLEEKIGQMLMPDFRKWNSEYFTDINDEVANIIDKYDLGGVILFAENMKETEQTTKLVHDLQQVAINDKDGNLPLLITVDQEGGIVTRLGTGTNFPGNMALGATRSEKNAYDVGNIMGKELASIGINVNFAPSVDINNNANNPVIGLRSISSNSELVGKLGVQLIKGMQSEGVAAAAKHFPGHGDVATDSHTGLPRMDKSLEQLKINELKPFQYAIDNGVDMIMTAHIQFPQIEMDKYVSIADGSKIELPATLSDDIINGLLRKDMGYDGVVITDAMNMEAISKNFGELEATKLAINAGIDIILMPTILRNKKDIKKLDNIVNGVIEAVNSGEISLEKINDSVKRIVKLKIDRGILGIKYNNKTLEEKITNAKAIVGCEKHREIERKISSEAITIVENKDNVLPFNPKENENILLIAPYENELSGMKFGINRLITEGKMPSINLITHSYNKQTGITEDLKNKINKANYVVILTEMIKISQLKTGTWPTSTPTAIIDYANNLNKDSVIVSIGNPYDVGVYANAKAKIIAYGYKGMDPTEADGGLNPKQAFGPNIPAAMEVILGAAKCNGILPVDIPTLENGSFNISKRVYNYGYGLTELNNQGTITFEIPKEIVIGKDFTIDMEIDDLNNLNTGKYSLNIHYNNIDFEAIKVETIDDNTEILLSDIKDSNIKVNLETLKKANEKTTLKITFKSKKNKKEFNIINDVKLIDSKNREFTTDIANNSILVNKDVNDSSNNEIINHTNLEKKLPNTDRIPRSVLIILGSIICVITVWLKKR